MRDQRIRVNSSALASPSSGPSGGHERPLDDPTIPRIPCLSSALLVGGDPLGTEAANYVLASVALCVCGVTGPVPK